tara:strand:- start:179 stop:808 length:630 start_codon:yes stop_codon:yes gene_type:complete
MKNVNNPLLIVANGDFPNHPIPKQILKNSKFIIACDGASNRLHKLGYKPNIIIGDLDSINNKTMKKFEKKLLHINNQNQNDFRKALFFCKINKLFNINVIGATGRREDHTIGNIFSINNSYNNLNIRIFTDFGCFVCINKPTLFNSFKNQQVSLFSDKDFVKVKTFGLKYNFNSSNINSLYKGTLNHSIGDKFFINIDRGDLIVYLKYK